MAIIVASGGPRDQTPAPDHTFTGYHQFPHGGSFEVFYHDRTGKIESLHADLAYGWYWWSCFPGCLPDSEATGPFPTAEGAYLDALGE